MESSEELTQHGSENKYPFFWEKDYHAMSTENKDIFFLSSTDTCTTPAGTWTLWQPSEKTPVLLLACINKSYDSPVPRGN